MSQADSKLIPIEDFREALEAHLEESGMSQDELEDSWTELTDTGSVTLHLGGRTFELSLIIKEMPQ